MILDLVKPNLTMRANILESTDSIAMSQLKLTDLSVDAKKSESTD